ncbi:transcriptional regulator with XRE-family HTH domain [Elusimicrobium simillimum]|uniref:helix-turn-helix domain-containing protein n=1 Tax=Elusimicrobium simillimum TaxID=3143438 RepID=UPI003C6EAFE1
MNIGKKILKARKELNLTQQQLADIIGQDRAAIARWEIGRFNPSTKNLEELAKALGKDYKYFYEDFDDVFPLNRFKNLNEIRDSGSPYPPALQEYPQTALLKKGEVIFLDTENVPLPHNVNAPHKFSVEIRDNSVLPDFEASDILEIQAVSKVEKAYENRYFLVQMEGELYIYRCAPYYGKMKMEIANFEKSVPLKDVVVLGRVVSVRRKV